MDYHYENLGPERFQQLCQSLLSQSFPKIQCFPVAQPDGGRDAVAYFLNTPANEYVVFQVKYVRNPSSISEPHKWLIDVLEEEIPKVKNLIQRGAKEYYLLTNVSGTAHLDSGSIDKVHNFLNKELGLPAQCWWRDDLNRRLDSVLNLKWKYPEILSGADLLGLLVESGLSDDKERRTNAIRAFLRDQYQRDREVRFKQVELENNLLDLFIDVPLAMRALHGGRKRGDRDYVKQSLLLTISRMDERKANRESESSLLGAAAALLNGQVQTFIPRVVLEGAPGQGKSTIVQYVCQIHRMRMLDEGWQDLPTSYLSNPVRLPFKIDLRDLSLWLSKQDPFSPGDTAEAPLDWQKSLEAFMAAQVRHHSGGANFSVTDLHAVFRLSAVLLVFDGLDEVAGIAKRKDVVDEIIKGVNRLDEIATSLQVVVTTRPAALANAPGLPEDVFYYLELSSITKEIIDDYATKWLRAKKLHGREAAEVKRILREKLDMPHLRELARNPMQLAILLSLIHTRGSSLPDKRTALYDSYVELFFSREAEKSSIVREHRDLLVDIHRYLAWTLHSEAEAQGARGTISTDRLQRVVADYLREEQHDVSLANQLFTGMVERVVALVSRVEGTFEFEVQPLREYFAARHLYTTAPYSPPGAEKTGTLPDRFDALARDFYWMNVARFYAGCYSKGELPSLVDRLEELTRDSSFGLISHPRILAATLLADWVFTQHPKSMRRVISLIVDEIGLRHLLAFSTDRFHRNTPMILPKQCGNDELIDNCFQMLKGKPSSDYSYMLIELISANASKEEIQTRWLQEIRQVKGDDRTHWLSYGLYLEALAEVSTNDLQELMLDEPNNIDRFNLLVRGARTAFCEETEERFTICVNAIFERRIRYVRRKRARSVLELLAQTIDPEIYAVAFEHRQPIPLKDLLERSRLHEPVGFSTDDINRSLPYPAVQKALQVVEMAIRESKRPAEEWATQITPWDNIVESARNNFGDSWALCYLSNMAAGIRSRTEMCESHPVLLDHSNSLCRRSRYARMRAGQPKWWADQFEQCNGEADLMLVSLLFLTWAGSSTIQKLESTIDSALTSLTDHGWSRLHEALAGSIRSLNRSTGREISCNLPRKISDRLIASLGLRARPEFSNQLYEKHLENYDGSDRAVLMFCQEYALRKIGREPTEKNWHKNLGVIEKSYRMGLVDHYHLYRILRLGGISNFPETVAKDILQHPDIYPGELVRYAEIRFRQILASNINSVGDIAKKGKWFSA